MKLMLSLEECQDLILKQIQADFFGYDVKCEKLNGYGETEVILTKKETINEN